MSGFAPNSEYVVLIKESPSGQINGAFPRTDATGAWSGPIYIHGYPPAANPPPSITLTGAAGTNADRDGELEAGEVVATDSFTIVCPERHEV
jgi:hypothetical protein